MVTIAVIAFIVSIVSLRKYRLESWRMKKKTSVEEKKNPGCIV